MFFAYFWCHIVLNITFYSSREWSTPTWWLFLSQYKGNLMDIVRLLSNTVQIESVFEAEKSTENLFRVGENGAKPAPLRIRWSRQGEEIRPTQWELDTIAKENNGYLALGQVCNQTYLKNMQFRWNSMSDRFFKQLQLIWADVFSWAPSTTCTSRLVLIWPIIIQTWRKSSPTQQVFHRSRPGSTNDQTLSIKHNDFGITKKWTNYIVSNK